MPGQIQGRGLVPGHCPGRVPGQDRGVCLLRGLRQHVHRAPRLGRGHPRPSGHVSARPGCHVSTVGCPQHQHGHHGHVAESCHGQDQDQGEGVDSGVHVVQAITLPPPGVNINQEIVGPGGQGDRRQEWQVQEVTVTWVESSNSWYGQMVNTRAEMREFLGRMSEFCDRSAQILYRDSSAGWLSLVLA